LKSLFNILSGVSFEIHKYSADDIIQAFNLIGCSFEIDIDFASIDDLISFISSPNSHIQKELYDKSIEFIASNFDQMTTKHIQQLSFQNIHSLMIYQSLKLQSETFYLISSEKIKENYYCYNLLRFFTLILAH
jgi:hypothetical protein